MPTRLPAESYHERVASLRERIHEAGVDAGVWFDATNIAYLTGFHHIQTERPLMLAITADLIAITVPRLEVERVEESELVDRVDSYFDYPGGDPLETAAAMLDDLGVEAVAADADGAPGVMGYEGPPLSDYLEVTTQDWVSKRRRVKSDHEIDLLRTSAEWAHLGHRYLAKYSTLGAHPARVSQRASMDASQAMLDALGARYAARVRGDGPVRAGYISGRETRFPHGHTPNDRLSRGDVIITGATANVDGYGAELERTMFLGEASERQRHHFSLMREAQSLAIETMGPEIPVSSVDQAVHDYAREQGVEDDLRHHVGHAIGLGAHEPPYIDRGNDAVMAPGHVYTVEPGLYTTNAGYRHSDTVAITETGTELLTYYPRSLDANIIEP